MAKGSKRVKAPSPATGLMDHLRKLGRRIRERNPISKGTSKLGQALVTGDYLKKNKGK